MNNRELDAKVAEKVMGYVWISPHGFKFLAPADWQKDDGFGYTTGRGPHQHVPFYSIEIDSAFAVVERMRERFRRVEVHGIGTDHAKGDAWICMIEAGQDEIDEHYIAEAIAATAPLAICLAALRAVEGEK